MNPLAWLGQRAMGALAVGALAGLLFPALPSFLPDWIPVLVSLLIFTVANFLNIDRDIDGAAVEKIWHRAHLPVPLISSIAVVVVVQVLPVNEGLTQAFIMWTVLPPISAENFLSVMLKLDAALAAPVLVSHIMVLPVSALTSSLSFTLLPVNVCLVTLEVGLATSATLVYLTSMLTREMWVKVIVLGAHDINCIDGFVSQKFPFIKWICLIYSCDNS